MPWTPVYRLDAVPGVGVAVFIIAVPNDRVTEADSCGLGASRMARHRAVRSSDSAADRATIPAAVSTRSVPQGRLPTALPQPPTGCGGRLQPSGTQSRSWARTSSYRDRDRDRAPLRVSRATVYRLAHPRS